MLTFQSAGMKTKHRVGVGIKEGCRKGVRTKNSDDWYRKRSSGRNYYSDNTLSYSLTTFSMTCSLEVVAGSRIKKSYANHLYWF